MDNLYVKLDKHRSCLTDDERIELYIDGYHTKFKKYGLARVFSRNKDCMYHGYGYRCLIKNRLTIPHKNGIEDLNAAVEVNEEYQSFSFKPIDMHNLEEYTDFVERLERRSVVFVVKTMITGLDLWKYIEKHDLADNKIIKSYPQKKLCEVIAKFENPFEIVYKKEYRWKE